MTSCKQLVETVTDYIEGTMSADDSKRFEAHLALCPPCVDYVEQMRATISALGRAPEEPPDPACQQQLLRAFRDWRSHREP